MISHTVIFISLPCVSSARLTELKVWILYVDVDGLLNYLSVKNYKILCVENGYSYKIYDDKNSIHIKGLI